MITIREIADNETSISNYCSDDAALSGTNAIRILCVSAFLGNGRVRSDGAAILSEAEKRIDVDVRYIGIAVSAVCKGGAG